MVDGQFMIQNDGQFMVQSTSLLAHAESLCLARGPAAK